MRLGVKAKLIQKGNEEVQRCMVGLLLSSNGISVMFDGVRPKSKKQQCTLADDDPSCNLSSGYPCSNGLHCTQCSYHLSKY